MKREFACAICVLALTAACADSAAPPSESSAAATAPKADAPAAAAAAPAPRQPRFREVTVPAGTTLSLTLDTAVSSEASKVEDTVRARLATALVINGTTAIPAGAEATGSVFEAVQSGRVKGRAVVSFGFDRLRSGKETYTISAARIRREAEATKGEDAAKIGLGAAAGAIVGALADGKKGAAVGSAVGAGAGTGVVLATRGEEVTLPAGTVVETTLEQPLKIQVPIQ